MTDPKQELIGAIDGDKLAKKLRDELAFPIEDEDRKFGEGVNSVCKELLERIELGDFALPSPDTSRDLTNEEARLKAHELFGERAWINFDNTQPGPYRVGFYTPSTDTETVKGMGLTWRSAFSSADKWEK